MLVRYGEEPEDREANGSAQLWLPGRRMVAGGGFWDPAFGRVGGGDDGSVLAATYADGERNHFLHRVLWLTQREDAPEDPATQQCRQVAEAAGALHLPVIRVETNGIGRFLPALLRRELARAGVVCQVREEPSRAAKAQRILSAFDPLLVARRLYSNDVLRSPFSRDMAEWRPEAKGALDDALDAAAGALLHEPGRLPGLPPHVAPRWRGVAWPPVRTRFVNRHA